MMLPTHILMGIMVATPLLFIAPEMSLYALIGAIFGSILPDLDLYFGHRESLHFPTLYPLLSTLSFGMAVVLPTPVTIGIGFAFLGAAIHCFADIYGGGLERRPWEQTSNIAVFDHVSRTWIPPRRVIRYDGAPEDLGIAVVLALPLYFLHEYPFSGVIVVALVIAFLYTTFRRQFVPLMPGQRPS